MTVPLEIPRDSHSALPFVVVIGLEVARDLPVVVQSGSRQRRTVMSALPDTKCLPSGKKAKHRMAPLITLKAVQDLVAVDVPGRIAWSAPGFVPVQSSGTAATSRQETASIGGEGDGVEPVPMVQIFAQLLTRNGCPKGGWRVVAHLVALLLGVEILPLPVRRNGCLGEW